MKRCPRNCQNEKYPIGLPMKKEPNILYIGKDREVVTERQRRETAFLPTPALVTRVWNECKGYKIKRREL